ncbi:MAG: hypothetical protein WCD47_16680 [Candidatus Sulfotelmatobacter sp.]
MKRPKTNTLTLTNDHLCSHTDAGKSTSVFYTDSTVVFSPIELHRDPELLQGGSDNIELDRN